MKTKIRLAAAMSCRPRLLILDEPASGLDPVARSQLMDIFQQFIQDEQNSIFLSTHITADLEKIADYITFLHKGRLICCWSNMAWPRGNRPGWKPWAIWLFPTKKGDTAPRRWYGIGNRRLGFARAW